MADNCISKVKKLIGKYEANMALLQEKKGEIDSHLRALNSEICQLQVTLDERLAEEGSYKMGLQKLCKLESALEASCKHFEAEILEILKAESSGQEESVQILKKFEILISTDGMSFASKELQKKTNLSNEKD